MGWVILCCATVEEDIAHLNKTKIRKFYSYSSAKESEFFVQVVSLWLWVFRGEKQNINKKARKCKRQSAKTWKGHVLTVRELKLEAESFVLFYLSWAHMSCDSNFFATLYMSAKDD